MSFSSDVKEELSNHISTARHCQIAELSAIISMCGRILMNHHDEYIVKIHTENLTVARKYFMLIREAFQIVPEVLIRKNRNLKNSKLYILTVKDRHKSYLILKATKLIDEFGQVGENLSPVDNLILQNICCKRAFIRGIFLTGGSMCNPEKTYHFEIVTAASPKAIQIKEIINSFDIDAKVVIRKKYHVVYVKEGSQIVDLLNIMEAHVALMDLENVRIVKEMRNSINRQVNCETANISKTVMAASKQIDDIEYIKNTIGLSELSEGMEDIARVRLERPDASLKELGELLSPPIGKSGVNHRLRKLSIIADNLREQKEDVSYGNERNNN